MAGQLVDMRLSQMHQSCTGKPARKRKELEDRDIEFSVVSGSNEEMLFRCLESLHKTLSGAQYLWSVTVTCNEPGTGLAGRVRARFPDATVIQSERSSGFAASHNRVLKSSRARYVWLLNDNLLLLPGTVQAVTDFMDRPGSARVGVVSPRLLSPDGSLQQSAGSFPSMAQILVGHSGVRKVTGGNRVSGFVGGQLPPTESSSDFNVHERPVEVDTLRAACVALRMKSVRQVGLMIDGAIVGSEEAEWHRRFKEQGWKVVYFPEAHVIHYGSLVARDGGRNDHPEKLVGALYFFRTGRSPVTYALFCATLLGIFGARAAYYRIARDKAGFNLAKRYTRVAWSGLRRD